jgi:hypothetical protein
MWGLRARIAIGFCLQITEKPGPRGFGFMARASAEGNLGIGKVQLYASFGLLIGTWGNEASSSGIIVTAEVALRIKVFYVFSFGASVKAIIEQLGPQEPNFKRTSLEVHIETPWWMPDVTFRLMKISGTAVPEQMPVLSSPLTSAAALEPGKLVGVDLATTAIGDPSSVHTIEALRATIDAPIDENAWATLTPVSLNSTIALDFAAALDNETTVVPTTPADSGLQAAAVPSRNDLSARYTLVQFGVRRRPRFGEHAGEWTDLLAPQNTVVGGLDELLGDPDIEVTFSSALRFRWDADVTRDNAIDTRRLLVNADTPFSFITSSPATDEGILATDPAYPCCGGKREPIPHVLDFAAVAFGSRAPVSQAFSNSDSMLRWLLGRPPVVAATMGSPANTHVARVQPFDFLGVGRLTLAVVTLDEPAYTFDANVLWKLGETGSELLLEAFLGLELVDRQVVPLSGASPAAPIHLQSAKGITSVVVRCTNPGAAPFELRSLSYRSLAYERDFRAEQARCRAGGHVAGGGKLAWLPNHDYELLTKVLTTVDYQGTAQTAEVAQRTGFRTKGLPGLNAVETPGAELEPYVESVYPGPTGLLYRGEPLVVAFNEQFSSLLPVERNPAPGDPQERTQILEWILAIAQGDGSLLSIPTRDWILDHRGTAPPPPRWPRVIDEVFVRTGVRHATSLSPFVARLNTLAASSPACGNVTNLNSSQFLRHDPVGEPNAGASEELWPASTVLRGTVRRKLGPFVRRSPFERGDETALTEADEGSPGATSWEYVGGTVRVSGAPTTGLRHYALFGNDDWEHVDVQVSVDPAGGAAGLALAVGGLPRIEQALVVLLDEAVSELQVLARRAGTTSVLKTVPLPASGKPYALQVTGFDDRLRARVLDTVIEVERGPLRAGRLALVSNGPGSFAALSVDGIDAYCFQAETSRYATFEDHLATWDQNIQRLPVDTTAAAALLTATSADISAAMTGGDSQLRQRVFDRWTAQLAIPLQRRPERILLAGDQRLLLLESPEPLSFSRDVKLTVTRTVTGFPTDTSGVPAEWLVLASSVQFKRDGVQAEIPAAILGEVQRAVRLVRAITDRLTRRIRYEFYAISISPEAHRASIHGVLDHVANTLGHSTLRVPLGQIAFLGANGAIVGPVLPLPATTTQTVPVTLLTNGAETAALLIPDAGEFTASEHDFQFAIDRVRYRATTTDGESNYRAAATWRVTL